MQYEPHTEVSAMPSLHREIVEEIKGTLVELAQTDESISPMGEVGRIVVQYMDAENERDRVELLAETAQALRGRLHRLRLMEDDRKSWVGGLWKAAAAVILFVGILPAVFAYLKP